MIPIFKELVGDLFLFRPIKTVSALILFAAFTIGMFLLFTTNY